MRGQLRIQKKPQIGGRQAGSHQRRILLDIIRYQPVVFGVAEFAEVPPRAETRKAEKALLLAGSIAAFCVHGPAIDPIRKEIGKQPESQDGRSNKQRGWGEPAARNKPIAKGNPGRKRQVGLNQRLLLSQFGLRRSFPFQQVAVGQGEPGERPNDGVQHDERLMRKEHEHDENVQVPRHQIVRPLPQKAAPILPSADSEQRKQELGVGGHQQQAQRDQSPVNRAAGQNRPTQDQQQEQADVVQAPPQVVEDLPAGNESQGIRHAAAVIVGNPGQKPPHDLPVAPHPAMQPAGIGAEMGRVIIDDDNVADQPGARVRSFDQIVAQKRIGGEAFSQDSLESFNFIDSLAREAALAKQVLVNVGDGLGVDVKSGLPRINRGEARVAGRLNADADARLENGVALDDGIGLRDRRRPGSADGPELRSADEPSPGAIWCRNPR